MMVVGPAVKSTTRSIESCWVALGAPHWPDRPLIRAIEWLKACLASATAGRRASCCFASFDLLPKVRF
jgi:hypothetical protein